MVKRKSSTETISRLSYLLEKYGDKSLINHFETQDTHLIDHQIRVTRMACRIAVEMGLSDKQEEALYIAACLHDIGMQEFKLSTAASPYNRLKIMEKFRKHPDVGARLVRNISTDVPVDKIILQHHERLDGSGFPNNIRDVMIESQIIAVVDILDGVYALHASKHETGLLHACDEINNMRNGLLDPDLIDLTINLAESENLIQNCSI